MCCEPVVRGEAADVSAIEGRAMATVCVEAVIDTTAQETWNAIADVGAVHRRLLPGRLADARIDGDTRILTMPDGSQIRELILAVDHHLRRLAYAVIDGQKTSLTHHHAYFQVFDDDDGGRSRLVWVTDVLPHDRAAEVRARVERAIAEMKHVIESARDHS
jgi:hypothetical protein